MATETQVPGSQTTQTLGISTVSLQAGSEGGSIINTRFTFQLLSGGEITNLTIGGGGSLPSPVTGQIWPSRFSQN